MQLIEQKVKSNQELLEKLISYLSPELSTLENENAHSALYVRAIVRQIWPELFRNVIESLDPHAIEENVKILLTLQRERAFYLLEKMRVKLGEESFNNVLQKATTVYDIEFFQLVNFLKLLTYVREDQLLASYLICCSTKYPDLIEVLNSENYLTKLVKHNCVVSFQAFFKIIKQSHDPVQTSSLMQALNPDNRGITPLHFAAISGNAEAMRAMVSLYTSDALKKQALNPDKKGNTPLHFAAMSGNAEAVRAVVSLYTSEALKEQALKPDEAGMTPLHFAAMSGNSEAVLAVVTLYTSDALKEQALRPNKQGMTPLHIAAKSGNSEAVLAVVSLYTSDALKEQALKPNNYGNTPLHIAAKSGNAEKMRALARLYTAPLLLEHTRRKPLLVELNEKTLRLLHSSYQDSSQEKRLIESELHLRLGEEKELCDKWKGWLRDFKECTIPLLSQIFLRYDKMAEILLENIGKDIEQMAKRLAVQDLPLEQKLSLLPFLTPDLARSTFDQVSEEYLSQAKDRLVSIGGVEGRALQVLAQMRTDWVDLLTKDTSPVVFATLQQGLAAFPIHSLAALARNPQAVDHLIPCLTACPDLQLAVIVPQLDDDCFRRAMEQSEDHRLSLLEKATDNQKQIYLDKFEREIGYQKWEEAYKAVTCTSLTSIELMSLQNQAIALKGQILRLINICRSERFANDRIRWKESLDEINKGLAAVRSSLNKAVDQEDENLPERFICSISGETMENPMRLPSGQVCDLSAIKGWLEHSNLEPFTRNSLTLDMVEPLPELKKEIADYQANNKPKAALVTSQ